MSTKIYNAFLVRPTHGIKDLIELGDTLYQAEISNYREHLSDMIAAIYEDKAEAERSDALQFFGCVCSESVQAGRRILNPSCSFVVYPVPEGKTGRETGLIEASFIVQFFGNGKAADEIINNTPWLVDVHYQDCTDRPDEISASEWESRELLWDSIFSFSPVPSRVGFSKDIVTKEDAYLAIWGEVLKRITGEDFRFRAELMVCAGMGEGWYSLVPKTMRAQWLGKKPLALDHYFPRIPAGCSVVISKTNEEKLQVSFRDAEGVLIHADDSPNLTALEQVEALLDDYGVHGSTP